MAAVHHLGAGAPGLAAPVAAQNDEDPGLAGDGVFREQETADSPDSEALRPIDQDDKELATLRAQLARHGWTLQVADAGHGAASFLVGRWGQVRSLPDRLAVQRFLRQIGGAS